MSIQSDAATATLAEFGFTVTRGKAVAYAGQKASMGSDFAPDNSETDVPGVASFTCNYLVANTAGQVFTAENDEDLTRIAEFVAGGQV
jgi:hypothetical protein